MAAWSFVPLPSPDGKLALRQRTSFVAQPGLPRIFLARDRAPGPYLPQGRVAPSERTDLEISALFRSALQQRALRQRPSRTALGVVLFMSGEHIGNTRAPACWRQAA
jgi:hypothetical protein